MVVINSDSLYLTRKGQSHFMQQSSTSALSRFLYENHDAKSQ